MNNDIYNELSKYQHEFINFIKTNDNLKNLYKNDAEIIQDLLIDQPDNFMKLHVLIAADSIYHKFRRDWTTKTFQKSIVEKPERVLSACIGIAGAISMFPRLFKILPKTLPYNMKFVQEQLSKSSDFRHFMNVDSDQSIKQLLFDRYEYIKSKIFDESILKIHDKEFLYKLIDLCETSIKNLKIGVLETQNDWNSGDMYLSMTSLDAITNSIEVLEESLDLLFKTNEDNLTKANRVFGVVRPPGHHCHKNRPEGFCLLNNVMITAQMAADRYGVTHVAILDYDLHHADGTQDIIFKRGLEENDLLTGDDVDEKDLKSDNKHYRKGSYSPAEPQFQEKLDTKTNKVKNNKYQTGDYLLDTYGVNIGSFSMHDINSYPVERGYADHDALAKASACVMAHNVNVWNIHLESYQVYTQDVIDKEKDIEKRQEMIQRNELEFLNLYEKKYRVLFTKADEFFKNGKKKCHENGIPFKGLVIISSGFDANEYETTAMNRHGMSLPTKFYNYFNKDALNLSQYHSDGKLISLMEGGYDSKPIIAGMFSALTGLQNQEWIDEWGSTTVIKELVKGSKAKWIPYRTKKNSNQIIKNWAESVIKLGRTMVDDFQTEFYDKVEIDPLKMYGQVYGVGSNADKNIYKSMPISQSTRSLRSTTTKSSTSSTESSKHKELKANTILNMHFSDDDEEEYVYNEDLEKSFNRTLEDVSMMDISKQMEGLDVSMAETTHNHSLSGSEVPRRSLLETGIKNGNIFMGRRRLGENQRKQRDYDLLKKKSSRSIRFENTPHDDDDGESLLSLHKERLTRSGRPY
ncbi:related to Histone deacetylase HOS3 [Hanseniaspora guilliermondii]|uniref:Related to Histone deacetylase HOS3 n=1 Tax=Hanseniaspora guilliermondii TaxID=56406 RepID=A0A1L0CP92_9ASCO|nr:related to Histone deacetylase HOS3 [Hanseniaspora guilliermondii]